MNDTDDVDHVSEEPLTCEVSDEALEALAADAALRVWTRVTTSCGGSSPGPGCG
jgi:hypothetical protein